MTPLVWVFALLAAGLHILVFVWEALAFQRPAVHQRIFFTPTADVPAVRLWAFGVGFYNLFLAIGAIIGIGCVAFAGGGSVQSAVGWTLVFSCCGSMLLAALVLALSGKKYLRAAAIQGVTPLLAVVLGLLAVSL